MVQLLGQVHLERAASARVFLRRGLTVTTSFRQVVGFVSKPPEGDPTSGYPTDGRCSRGNSDPAGVGGPGAAEILARSRDTVLAPPDPGGAGCSLPSCSSGH